MDASKHITSKQSFLRKFLGLIPIKARPNLFNDILGKDYFLFRYVDRIFIAKHHDHSVEYRDITQIYNERIPK